MKTLILRYSNHIDIISSFLLTNKIRILIKKQIPEVMWKTKTI